MIQEQIIKTLKDSYPRDTRKQLVKSIQQQEKDTNFSKDIYNIINQIFSYVLQESNWDISTNSHQWDAKPLGIMQEVFPNIQNTKWYKEQIIVTNEAVQVVKNETNY